MRVLCAEGPRDATNHGCERPNRQPQIMWSFRTATVRFSITTSSKKVAPNNCDNDRQPEVAIRPPISGGTVIVSVEISTMTSSRKCSQVIAITTNYGTVLQYCFRLRIASVHVSMQSRQMPKRHFCLFVTVTKVLTKRKSVNITVILLYHQIFTMSPQQ